MRLAQLIQDSFNMLGPLSAKDFPSARDSIYHKLSGGQFGKMVPGLGHEMVHAIVELNYKKIFNDDPSKIMGIFNDLGYRSDDFIQNHGGKLHVLYAGCSFTYAEGVPIDLSWSGLVNKYINNHIATTSGYFNIGKGGAELATMINNIMGYMSYAGIPDIVFLNLPEIGRERLEYRIPIRTLADSDHNTPSNKHLITIEAFRDRLINLRILFKLLGSQLIIGTWTMNTNNFKELSNMYGNPFDSLDVIDLTVSSGQSISDTTGNFIVDKLVRQEVLEMIDRDTRLSQIIDWALDDSHPGLAGHYIMAQNFIKALRPLHD